MEVGEGQASIHTWRLPMASFLLFILSKKPCKRLSFLVSPLDYLVMLIKMMFNLMVVLLSREKIVGTRKPS